MITGPSLLFAPADRPDRVRGAAQKADAVIVDFEDGVLPQDRGEARGTLHNLDVDPARVIVRVNPVGTDDFTHDIAAVLASPYRTIMVAKTATAADIDATPAEMDVIALCETAEGIVNATAIARHPRVTALMWGAEDLIASLGGTSSRGADGTYRDVARAARSAVLLAAGAAGKVAIDAVYLDIADSVGLERECEDAAASGFGATACIHPSQIEVIRRAYLPSPAQIAAARAVLAAARTAAGVFRHEGRMVDEPVLRHARAVLQKAGLSAPS